MATNTPGATSTVIAAIGTKKSSETLAALFAPCYMTIIEPTIQKL